MNKEYLNNVFIDKYVKRVILDGTSKKNIVGNSDVIYYLEGWYSDMGYNFILEHDIKRNILYCRYDYVWSFFLRYLYSF